jgi:hypothetical protein
MPKFNEEVVEMTKIINQTPFETLWLYWEHDIVFTITGTTSQIKVTTHDKTLSDYPAYIGYGNTFSTIPTGTYSIGTYSNPYPIPGYDDFKLIVGTPGYISHVLNGTISLSSSQEAVIPNYSETYIEKETDITNLVPFYKESAPGDYREGASYSVLTIRSTSFTLNNNNNFNPIINIDDVC